MSNEINESFISSSTTVTQYLEMEKKKDTEGMAAFVYELQGGLDADERRFLHSLAEGQPGGECSESRISNT